MQSESMQKYFQNKEWYLEKVLDGTSGVLIPQVSAKLDLSKIVQLNQSGVCLWEKLEQGATLAELSEKLCSTFKLSHSPTAEVQSFLDNAAEIGAISTES